MRIINAIWEKRNLGVETNEIECDGTESLGELKNALLKELVDYNVLKIPTGNFEMLSVAQEYGFKFVELNYRMARQINSAKLPDIYKRFENKINIIPASEEMEKRVLNEIGEGTIFTTDRIAIDPMFSIKIAGIRYQNWCADLIRKGSSIDVAYYKDEPVAFNIDSQPDEKDVCKGILGGVLTNARDRGLGFLVPYMELETCKRLGGKTIIASVSSNNLPILKLHLQFGLDIKETRYVLIKHQ